MLGLGPHLKTNTIPRKKKGFCCGWVPGFQQTPDCVSSAGQCQRPGGGRRRRKALLGSQDLAEGLRWPTPRQQGLPAAATDGPNRLAHWGLSHHGVREEPNPNRPLKSNQVMLHGCSPSRPGGLANARQGPALAPGLQMGEGGAAGPGPTPGENPPDLPASPAAPLPPRRAQSPSGHGQQEFGVPRRPTLLSACVGHTGAPGLEAPAQPPGTGAGFRGLRPLCPVASERVTLASCLPVPLADSPRLPNCVDDSSL